MRLVFSLLFSLFLLQSFAFAQVPDKWFSAALARSDGFAIAQNEAQNAKLRLQRLKTDPFITKPLLLEATTALELSEARVIAARLEVRRGLWQDAFSCTSTQDTLEVALAKLDLADTNAKAANARLKTGAITAAEFNRAEADLRASQSEVTSAQAEAAAASEVLKNRLGFVPDNKTPNQAIVRPSRQMLERNLEFGVRTIEAKGALARAKLDLEIKDNEYSALAEITEAKRVVANSERNLADIRNSSKAIFLTRWENYGSASSALTARDRAVALAKDELKTQNERLQRGLISKLVVLQARVNLAQQLAAFEQSRQRLALAVLELAVLVNLDIWQSA